MLYFSHVNYFRYLTVIYDGEIVNSYLLIPTASEDVIGLEKMSKIRSERIFVFIF